MLRFFALTPKPGDDLFTYITSISSAVRDIERLNETRSTKIKIPDYVVVVKMFQALQVYPHFDYFYKSFLVKKPREWLKLTPAELLGQLRAYIKGYVHA